VDSASMSRSEPSGSSLPSQGLQLVATLRDAGVSGSNGIDGGKSEASRELHVSGLASVGLRQGAGHGTRRRYPAIAGTDF
jgi:hypothetical protein